MTVWVACLGGPRGDRRLALDNADEGGCLRLTLDLSGGKAYYRIDPDAHPIQTTHSPGASGAI